MAATAEKTKTLADILASATRKYDLRVGPLSAVAEDVEAFTTGNLAIDHIIGVGGLPVGRSVELFGPPSSGKTTTALQAAAALQQTIIAGGNADPARGPLVAADDVIVYFDYEHAMDPTYVKALGLDVDHPSFLFSQPETLEQGANVARDLIASGKVRMVIFDSVASMTPSAKSEAEVGKSLPAVQAKLMSDFLQPLNALLHEHRCTAVFLNHVMELMEMGGRRPGMPPKTSTPGGRALKFYASVRVEYQQVGNVKAKVTDPLTREEIEQVEATNVRVRVIKNKVAAPFRQAVVRVRFKRGFDNFWTALQILVAHKKIVYSSGFFYFERSPDLVHDEMARQATGSKRPYIRGESVLFEFADAHPAWRRAVIEAAARVVSVDPDALEAVTPVRAPDAVTADEDTDPTLEGALEAPEALPGAAPPEPEPEPEPESESESEPEPQPEPQPETDSAAPDLADDPTEAVPDLVPVATGRRTELSGRKDATATLLADL